MLLSQPNIDINDKEKDGKNAITIILELSDLTLRKNILNIFIDFVLNKNVNISRDTFGVIIKNCNNTDVFMSRIFNPLNFDCSIVAKMLDNPNNVNKNKIFYYCNLHTNVRKEILKNLSGHKEELYCKPHNIISLCSEVNFKLKFKNKTEIFEELDGKLKSLFGIKNADDMIDKISYHLCWDR